MQSMYALWKSAFLPWMDLEVYSFLSTWIPVARAAHSSMQAVEKAFHHSQQSSFNRSLLYSLLWV